MAPSIALTWFALVVNPVLAAITAVSLALALLLPFLSAHTTWAASRAVAEQRGRVATHIGDDVQGVREVLAFEAQTARLASLDTLDRDLTRSGHRLAQIIAVRHVIERGLWAAGLVALLLVGAPVNDTVLALALTLALWFSDAGTDDFATGLDAAFAACARIYRTSEAPPAVLDRGTAELELRTAEVDRSSADGATRERFEAGPEVVFECVTFRYPGARLPALSNADVRFAAGEWHSIVGVSGSGKSTIAALLMRTWDPDSGQIRIDGIPLPSLSVDALRVAVAVVKQRPILFEGTVATNLRLARPEASDAELLDALRIARLDHGALVYGLDTSVEERGTTLSGGQLQRLALARALVARPRLLVLDEALSQLDAETAAEVRKRLRRAMVRSTIIEITHRVDLIPDDGQVTIIDRGEVLESGRAGILTQRSEAFSRLLLRGEGASQVKLEVGM